MSKDRHRLQLTTEEGGNTFLRGHAYRQPSQPEYDDYLTYSSSPARSSSPPSTPYSSRRDSGYAYISSSPGVPVDALFKQYAADIGRRPTLSSKSPYTNATFRYGHYGSGDGFQKDAYNKPFDSVDENVTSSDSEDMEDTWGINTNTHRNTFFRISAERGLWRSDPLSSKRTTPSTLQGRKSVPTFSRVPTPLPLTTRTVSEPAPSNVTTIHLQMENAHTTELSDSPRLYFAPSVESKPEDETSSPHTLSSWLPDAEDLIEFDALEVPSSSLPPSSPPLSPRGSIPIISRSSSPMSFAFEGSSSPLSELPDDYDNEGSLVEDEDGFTLNDLGMQITERTIIPLLKMEEDIKVSEHALQQATCRDLSQEEQDLSPFKPQSSPLLCSEDPLTLSPIPGSSISNMKSALLRENAGPVEADERFSSTLGHALVAPCRDEAALDNFDVNMTSESALPSPGSSAEKPDGDSKGRCSSNSSRNLVKSSALKDKNGVMHRSSGPSRSSTSRASLPKAGDCRERKPSCERRANKQSDVRRDDEKSDAKLKKTDRKKRVTRDDEEDVENDGSSSVAGSKRKRLKRRDGDIVVGGSTKRIQKPSRPVRPTSVHDNDEFYEPLDAEARELHATICGLIIETMATSRASSLPASSLVKHVMSSQPYLKDQRSERDWLSIFERVLQDGSADRGSGVFGKVESSGKDDSNRPLEAQWFYVPERDEDQERAALIRSMMPRPGKRTETMKYKQYYWRPLGKISKWDPEDAL